MISVGVIVRLVSGGPKMAVVRKDGFGDDTCAECQWFDKDDHLHQKRFLVSVLEEVIDNA